MYGFIDVNEVSEGTVLPSEALQINGEYIENLISGYRTLSVSGREALSPDVTTFETGVRDGSTLKGKRYPARIIIIKYQLIAESNEAFREAYNQLGKILDVENAKLIFADETDKYYTGTPCYIDEVPPGRNSVVGKIEIICTDPFKYSVMEHEAIASIVNGNAVVDYHGTYKSYPILETDFYSETEVAEDGETAGQLTGSGDCGYVAFFNENEKIIQLGDPDEADGTEHAKAQTLMNQTFMGDTAWGTTAKALWKVNAGKVLEDSVEVGSVAMEVASQETSANTSTKTKTILTIVSSGTPGVHYSVSVKTSNRTANTVLVEAVISGWLGSVNASLQAGYSVIAGIYVDGQWHNVTLKAHGEIWKDTTIHSKSVSFTVDGLTASTNSLTGIQFRSYRSDSGSIGKVNAINCVDIPVSTYSTSVVNTNYYLSASAYENNTNVWHGPSIIRQIGADSSGEVGAVNFTLTYKQKMCIAAGSSAQKQRGAFQMQVADSNGKNICGVRIVKNKTGKAGSLVFYVNGAVVNTTDIDLHYNNYYFGSSVDAVQTTTITKTGKTITFAVGGYKRQFNVDALAETAATSVTFMFERFSTYPVLEYNGLYWAKFVKNNCDTYKDIPNKFSANDVLEANCRTGEIYLNGIAAPDLGALGNDWEGFYLSPGFNLIGVAYSDWVTDEHAPTFKIRYREVFL